MRTRLPFSFWSVVIAVIASGCAVVGHAQEFERGRLLYQQQCASCHGEQGGGVESHYDQPLHGDLSIRELANVIQTTMPEDAPGSLSTEDATAIAIFAHHEFYSQMAQLRNAPPRVELTHLTVEQFRRSVLDLMTPFTYRPERWTDQRGLKRVIHQGDWGKDRKQVEETIDHRLHFDWGDAKPIPEVDHEKWNVRWQGSILAPISGTYEFYLDATLRANLYINDDSVPFIDASVVSFEKSLNTASIFLVGGQSYHFALDVSRSKEPNSRVLLEWRPPNSVRQPIPKRLLSPTWSPIQLICSTPFPPDDSSVGYERGRTISREWYEANVAASIEVADKLTANLKRWMHKDANDPQNVEAVRGWCHRWVSLALRHTLSDEEKKYYIDQHFEGESSIERGVKKVCLLALTSPEFQYPGLRSNADESKVGRLALILWDSIPEEWMLEMVDRKELTSPESVRNMAERMMQDPRFQEKVRGFLREFLGLRYLRELAKDSAKYPEFTPSVAADLRESMEMMLDEFASNPASDFRTLLTTDQMYLNGSLAPLYGVELAKDAPFQKVSMPRDRWSGVLSHPFLMSSLAYHNASSPVHRGVFLAKRILGRALRPPVDAIIPISEDTAPGLTTRERVALQTQGAMCQSCHRVINPLGFTLENYDAMGRFRVDELQKPIDASGQYIASDGSEHAFQGVRPLADFLAESPEVRQSVVRQMFQYFVKQPVAAYGLEQAQALESDWLAQGCTIASLARQIAVVGATLPEIGDNGPSRQVSLLRFNPSDSRP